MDPGGDLAAAGEDRLSTLPDDILAQILGPLPTPDAVRTSLVSRRWRRVWELLPELRFFFFPEPSRFRDALAAHQVRLRFLQVWARDGGADTESLAIWLPAAAARVSGHFILINGSGGQQEEAVDDDDFVELPCFPEASAIVIRLRQLGLAVAPAGVFARLTSLNLGRVRLHGDLGDAISSPRCPCLQELRLFDTRGLEGLTIRSQTLVKMELESLHDFWELTVEAPELKELSVVHCLLDDPAATISAPRLESLEWKYSAGEMESVQLGEMPQLRSLGSLAFFVYGLPNFLYNRACVQFLQRFRVIETLRLMLNYLKPINTCQYLMEEMNVLPDLTILHLIVTANGHVFGASAFHVLKMCTGIRELVLELSLPSISEVQTPCPPGCICNEHPDWKTEGLLLVNLHEIKIQELRGSDHEVSFVTRLFDWATLLKKVTVTFDASVTESKAKELCQTLSFSTPGVCMDFRYHNNNKVLHAPQG